MNRSGLLEALGKEANLTKKVADEVIDVIFSAMSQALINVERIEIRGFGSFVVRKYGSYIGRNPRTGEAIQVPSKKLPFFKPGRDLKERVDERDTT
jgi:integration host factor subunit beta